jgi:hypothetical protein
MPADFDKCVADGGRVRTKKLSGKKYMHVCFINGKSYAGEVKTKVGGSKKGNKAVKKG